MEMPLMSALSFQVAGSTVASISLVDEAIWRLDDAALAWREPLLGHGAPRTCGDEPNVIGSNVVEHPVPDTRSKPRSELSSMTPEEEDKLVRLLKQRNEAAFRKLVTLHQHKVYNLVYRMLGNAAEAEDLAQEVFVTVFRSIDTFRGESKFSTWLFRIATNHAKNRIKYLARRKTKQRQAIEDVDESALDNPIGSRIAGPDKVVLGKELEGVLKRAMEALDEEHRTLIVLREFECLGYTEIGEITNLAPGTVKSRLHRARLQLKAVVDLYQEGEPIQHDPENGRGKR